MRKGDVRFFFFFLEIYVFLIGFPLKQIKSLREKKRNKDLLCSTFVLHTMCPLISPAWCLATSCHLSGWLSWVFYQILVFVKRIFWSTSPNMHTHKNTHRPTDRPTSHRYATNKTTNQPSLVRVLEYRINVLRLLSNAFKIC